MFIKNLLSIMVFIILFVGCSTVEMITKNNNINIENYPEGIINLHLKDGRIIDFNKNQNLKYKLYGNAVIIIENDEVKEQIQLADIKYYQVQTTEKDSVFSNGYAVGLLMGGIVFLISIAGVLVYVF